MIAYVFPGQGSQRPGMGAGLFEKFPRLTAMADQILGYSIERLCLESEPMKLAQTEYTQPAIYVVSCLDYLRKVSETGRRPDFIAGHSLGEYAALFAAGAYDFITGLKLVQARSRATRNAPDGGMAAVIGMAQAAAQRLIDESPELDGLDIANDNSPIQLVLSGPGRAIAAAEAAFERAGAKFIPLPITGPFHSRHMHRARMEFEAAIARFRFHQPLVPVIANSDVRPLDANRIAAHLGRQITHGVRWTETVRYLLSEGVTEFCEIGGTEILGKLVAQTRDHFERHQLAALAA